MTNTYFAPGDHQVADLIEAAGTGLYAVSFGGGQVEPATVGRGGGGEAKDTTTTLPN